MVQGHFKGCLEARTPIPAEQLCPTLSTSPLPILLYSSLSKVKLSAARDAGFKVHRNDAWGIAELP